MALNKNLSAKTAISIICESGTYLILIDHRMRRRPVIDSSIIRLSPFFSNTRYTFCSSGLYIGIGVGSDRIRQSIFNSGTEFYVYVFKMIT